MSSWSNTDTGGSAPLWASASVKKAPTAANMHDVAVQVHQVNYSKMQQKIIL